MHRSIEDKAIWKCSSPEHRSVLITILLNVNHEASEWIWKGEKFTCKPGQMITSLSSLAKKSGVSVKNVRTALSKFEKLGFLANESAKTGRLITVVNWEFYQSNGNSAAKEQADRVQTNGSGVAPNKNNKNNKNEKNTKYTCAFEEFWKVYPRKKEKANAYKCYKARLNDGYSEDDLLRAAKAYADECKEKGAEERYIKHGSTFLSASTPFADYIKEPQEEPKEDRYANDWLPPYLRGRHFEPSPDDPFK